MNDSDLMKPRVGLLSNPNSGRNRKQPGAIQRIVADHPRVHHQPTASAAEIPAALVRLAEQAVDVLAINGGDGTSAEVLGCLFEEQPFTPLPRIVLLPGGTTNMNAADTGMRGNLLKAVTHLCEWSAGEREPVELLQRPVLRVEYGAETRPAYGMFFGAGAIIQGIEYCHANIHSRGIGDEIGPGLAMARTLWGIARQDPRFTRPVNMSMTLDEQPATEPQETLLLFISSLERLFLGMRPYWGTESAPLHVTLVRHRAKRFLRNLPTLLRGNRGGRLTAAAGYRSHNAHRIELTWDGTWTLDGEMYPATSASGPVVISNAGNLTFVSV